MPDRPPNPAPVPAATPGAPVTKRAPVISTTHEFGNAKRNLPPVKVLLLTMASILVIAGIASFFQRAKPQGSGSLDNVVAVEIPGQTAVLTALTFTLRNSGKKPLWVHNIQGKLTAADGEQNADAVSAIDFDRYYQAFPALKTGALAALVPEDKLQPGQEVKRTVVVSFPVTLEAFNQRKSVSVVVQPYDQPLPVTLTR